jgi:hypothetical protein
MEFKMEFEFRNIRIKWIWHNAISEVEWIIWNNRAMDVLMQEGKSQEM